MMDTRPAVQWDWQQYLVVDELLILWSTSVEMLQEGTWHVSLKHLEWLCGPS